MGQHAVECEPTETQLYVKNHEKFLACLGMSLDQVEVLPAMVPQFNYRVGPDSLSEFRNALDETTLNGTPLSYREAENGFVSIDLGQRNLMTVELVVKGLAQAFPDTGLENTVIEDMSSASAYHIPEGHLWVYHPSHKVKAPPTQVDALDFFSSTLNNFGLASNSNATNLL